MVTPVPVPRSTERAAGPEGARSQAPSNEAIFADLLRRKQAGAAESGTEKSDATAVAKTDDVPSDGGTGAPPPATPAPPASSEISIAGLVIDPARASSFSPPRADLRSGLDNAPRSGVSTDPRSDQGEYALRPAATSVARSAGDTAIRAAPAAVNPSAVDEPATAMTALPGGAKMTAAASAFAAGARADARHATPSAGNMPEASGAGVVERGQNAAETAKVGEPSPRAGATRAEAIAPDAPPWPSLALTVDSHSARAAASTLLTIEAPVGSPRFADETAQKVTWMVKNGLAEAEIRVRPADLGPISVRIEMNQNEALISFAVTQPESRAAVQDALHRLTEMLAEQGVSLGEASVGGRDFTQQPRDGSGSGRSRLTFSPGTQRLSDVVPATRLRDAQARGMVDTFA